MSRPPRISLVALVAALALPAPAMAIEASVAVNTSVSGSVVALPGVEASVDLDLGSPEPSSSESESPSSEPPSSEPPSSEPTSESTPTPSPSARPIPTHPLGEVAVAIGADQLWERGITGAGIGVALIDTGVVPVPGLDASGKLVYGPDLSFESTISAYRHLDTYGHGTHLAGIIAGNDPSSGFVGIAPGAHIVSLKVAGNDGAVDVTQVIAALGWTVAHAKELGVRVISLSYGTTGTQDAGIDPLVHAVEQARLAGLVVVVAGGNEGFGSASLNTPATHPGIIAVGSADLNGTISPEDDTVSSFSSHGVPSRPPTLMAPGRSLVSLRNPGSTVDEMAPAARRGERHFAGSGTSQSAAVTAGAVALLLQERPALTPDQVAHLLKVTASSTPNADRQGRGAGRLDIAAAAAHAAPAGTTDRVRTAGTGSLEASRGTYHVSDGTSILSGERDIFGTSWSGGSWASAATNRTVWTGGVFLGRRLVGDCFCEQVGSARAWSGVSWASYTTWSGRPFPTAGDNSAGRSWSGSSWSGSSWSGSSWSGSSWSGSSWSGSSWSGSSWSTGLWS